MTYPPRCLRCNYILTGLEAGCCPECGQAFNLHDGTTYSTKPLFNRMRYWLPGILLTFVTGAILYPSLIYLSGFGWSTTLVLPLCLGLMIGYGCRYRRAGPIVLLALIVLGGLVCGLFTLNILGVFCGMVLMAVAVIPLLLGVFFGWILRVILKSTSWEQRWHLPTFCMVIAPLLFAAIEREASHPYADESVNTTIVLPASVDRAWDSLMFYEEVQGTPPLLMRFALPHPLYTRGSTQRVGDTKVCVYSKGRLVKLVTQRVPDKLLGFTVIEQTKIENRSVVLKGGSFQFTPISATQTRVTLTTTYQPLLGPRWAWRWAECWGIHTLHQYVLVGMGLKSEQATDQDGAKPAVAAGNGL